MLICNFTETYQLSGFDEFATIPITFPLDICLMEVNNNLYAVCLALDRSQHNTKTYLKVLQKVVSSVCFFRQQFYIFIDIFQSLLFS